MWSLMAYDRSRCVCANCGKPYDPDTAIWNRSLFGFAVTVFCSKKCQKDYDPDKPAKIRRVTAQ